VVQGVQLPPFVLKYAPSHQTLESIQKWSVQPPLFTCDCSFHMLDGSPLTACSGSIQARKSTCLADFGQLLFHPLAVHFTVADAFWFPDVAVEDVEATNQSTGDAVVVREFVSVPVIVSPVFDTFPVICVCIELVAPFKYESSVSDGYVAVGSDAMT